MGSDAQTILDTVRKEYGPESIIQGDNFRIDCDVISTRCISLDLAIGVGGIPRGKVTEIYGPESSGKTTLALHAIAEAQSNGDLALLIDAEHAFDPTYAGNIGINVSKLLISQPDFGEQALQIVEKVAATGKIAIIVVDSVAALVPKAELEGDMGDHHVGLQARLMSQALRKLTGVISKSNTALIFINQIRSNIGKMGYGSPDTTTGGRALKFYSSVRLDIRRIGSIKTQQGEVTANRTRVKVVKNKVASPFRQAEFDIVFGKGISHAGCLVDIGCDCGVISKSGSWYSYNGNKIGNGREKVVAFLEQDEGVANSIEAEIHEKLFVD